MIRFSRKAEKRPMFLFEIRIVKKGTMARMAGLLVHISITFFIMMAGEIIG